MKNHEVTCRILNQAVKYGLINKNPADAAQSPSADDRPLRMLTMDQVKQVLEHVKGTRWYPIYCVAVGCGLREGEVSALRKSDVFLDAGVLKVEQTVYSINGHVYIGTPKSTASQRVVGMPDFVIAALKVLWETSENDQFLFRTRNNTPIAPRNLLRHFHQTLEGLKISWVTFHSLRHFWVSALLAKNTVPPQGRPWPAIRPLGSPCRFTAT